MANKKFKNYSTIDKRMGKKDPLADYKASERRKKKIKDMGSFDKGGIGRAGSLLSPAGVGALGRGIGSRQKRRKMPEAGLQEKKQNEINKQRMIDTLTKRFNKFKKKPSKPAIPLGKMKKGPKPGSFDYVLQQTMKPGYKVAPMKDGGKVKKKKMKNPMKEDRVREGMKSKYRKMGFGEMMDKGEIDFSNYKAGGKVKKPMGSDKKSKFLQRRISLGGRLPLPLLIGLGLGKAAKKFFKDKDVGKFPAVKPKKKMGGGMMKKPMNYNKGGVCRGMGAAIRGGNFKGVK